jgi:uncharacterized cofD-like protein
MAQVPNLLNLVAIGGGTGLSSLLAGLKAYVVDARGGESYRDISLKMLTAVVTVTDDGGSSGRLREEFNILPPGDIRNCLVALSEDERLLARLFQYRFPGTGDLHGHSFGNLFLTALTGVTGDFLEAVRLSSEVLAIRGRIFPSTITDVSLMAELDSGQVVLGESNISKSRSRIRKVWLSPEHCRPLGETLEAIEQADVITLGPGSLFTSVIPNLLVDGIADAIARSSAVKIYISNIMTQPGETDGFGLEEHLSALFDCAPQLNLDYLVVNLKPVTDELRQIYAADGAVQIGLDYSNKTLINFRGRRIEIVAGDLLDEGDKVRHAPRKLACILLDMCHARPAAVKTVELSGCTGKN